jgi:catechol 2,3-dioxygenase-like lactoylglutathione lyase family enzyme
MARGTVDVAIKLATLPRGDITQIGDIRAKIDAREHTMTTVIKRTTLIVRDVETAMHWYQTVLEMSVYFDDEVELSGTGMAAGGPGDRTLLVIMRAEDPDVGMIGLLQWIDPPLPAPADIPRSVTYGNPTFVVRTDDLSGLHDRAVTLGSHVHAAPHEWSIRGANGMVKHFLSASLFDPDGHFFELNQLLRETAD